MKPFATVPVKHLGQDGQASADHVWAPPCVEVLFTFRTGQTGDVTYEGRVWALIDTGADINLINSSLVPSHAALNANIQNTGIGGAVAGAVYLADLNLVGSGKAFTTQVSQWTPGARRPYRMILGRLILRHTRFVYDGASGITALEIL